MKKLLMFSLALIVFSGFANAAVPACTLGPVITVLTSIPNSGCDVGDEEFSGFAALPTGIGLQFLQTGNLATVNFVDLSGTGLVAFTESYTTNIDPAAVPAGFTAALTRVAAGLQDGNANGNAKLTKTTTGGFTGTATATDVGGTITPTVISGISVQSLNIVDMFTIVNGDILNASNTYTVTQTATTAAPEPVSMLLFGSGLMGVWFIGRKKLVRK